MTDGYSLIQHQLLDSLIQHPYLQPIPLLSYSTPILILFDNPHLYHFIKGYTHICIISLKEHSSYSSDSNMGTLLILLVSLEIY